MGKGLLDRKAAGARQDEDIRLIEEPREIRSAHISHEFRRRKYLSCQRFELRPIGSVSDDLKPNGLRAARASFEQKINTFSVL
jgi:hypothetical protein